MVEMMNSPAALDGIRILELAQDVSGEYCGKLLADFGAQVIKIEPPGGSPVRALSPLGQGDAPENSALFAYLNTNKRSVVLDLDSPEGAQLLARLARSADVVVDDHEPGWLAAHGFDPASLAMDHPQLVLCSITPHGQHPSQVQRHAEDLTVFHASGWGYHTPSGNDGTRPPLKGAGRFLPSYESALDAALCIVAALHGREDGGAGRFIDISKTRALYSRIDYVLGAMLVGDMDTTTAHTALDLGGPASILPCRDGFIYIWVSDEPMWQALRAMIGEDTAWMDEDFPENWLQTACTADRVARTRKHLTTWLAGLGKHEVAAEAQARGIMIVPLNNPEDIIASPQIEFREFFTRLAHPVLGQAHYPTVPYKLSVTPAAIETPAPILGEDTGSILSELGEGQ